MSFLGSLRVVLASETTPPHVALVSHCLRDLHQGSSPRPWLCSAGSCELHPTHTGEHRAGPAWGGGCPLVLPVQGDACWELPAGPATPTASTLEPQELPALPSAARPGVLPGAQFLPQLCLQLCVGRWGPSSGAAHLAHGWAADQGGPARGALPCQAKRGDACQLSKV